VKSIIEILQEIRPEFDFSTSQDFLADGMLDSFDVMTLVSDLEKNFGVIIDGMDIVPANVKNLDAIEKLVAKHRAGK
jgi:acyl carrier protein